MRSLVTEALEFSQKMSAGFDKRWNLHAFRWTLGIALFLFPFGVFFNVAGVLPDSYGWTASIVIALSAGVTLLSELRCLPPTRAAGTFVAITVLLFFVELFGMQSGYPFGRYTYSGILGFSLLGVPLAIALAWYATIVNARRIAEGLFGPRSAHSPARTALIAAILTVAMDILLEPMASEIERYWVWHDGVIPVQNYLCWFVVSGIAVFVLAKRDGPSILHREAFSRVGVLLFAMQGLLFALTDAVHGFLLPVAIAMCVFAALLLARAVGTSRALQKVVTLQ